MSKSMNMLRTRRRDNNVKPNRRLDRKSSRGMIYENEELRLKTININAEIERGQSDIKKLRRENELLKKEIWYIRDEYEKLEKLLKQKKDEFSSSSTCSSDSESETISEDSKEVETTQNLENVQKTNMKNLQVDFDHLSVVPEEPSTENSDKSRTSFPETPEIEDSAGMLPPDQSYPDFPMTKHFFSPLPSRPLTPPVIQHFYTFRNGGSSPAPVSGPPAAKAADLIVKTDNRSFESLDAMQMLEMASTANQSTAAYSYPCPINDQPYQHQFSEMDQPHSRPRSSFSNGGNLEELLNDIQTISEDILKISSPTRSEIDVNMVTTGHYPLDRSTFNGHFQSLDRLSEENVEGSKDEKYKSEISVVLMPTPMPLIGLEKYQHLSSDHLDYNNMLVPSPQEFNVVPSTSQEFNFVDSGDFKLSGIKDNCELQTPSSQEDLLVESRPDLSNSSDQMHSDPEIQPLTGTTKPHEKIENDPEQKKMSIRRKVSIHFKGRKEKNKKPQQAPALTISAPSSPSLASTSNTPDLNQTSTTEPLLAPNTSLPLIPAITNNTTHSSTTGQHSSDSDRPSKSKQHQQNKSTSASPERPDTGTKKHHKHKKKKKIKGDMIGYLGNRRNTLSTDRVHRERSVSICTDRSNLGPGGPYMTDDYVPSSERERTNSLSSCGTNNVDRNRASARKFSNLSHVAGSSGGSKIPWCACWGNGCI